MTLWKIGYSVYVMICHYQNQWIIIIDSTTLGNIVTTYNWTNTDAD